MGLITFTVIVVLLCGNGLTARPTGDPPLASPLRDRGEPVASDGDNQADTEPDVLESEVLERAKVAWVASGMTEPKVSALCGTARIVLRAHVRGDFKIYDEFMTSHDAVLSERAGAWADIAHDFGKSGVDKDQWARMTGAERFAAVWTNLSARGAVWKRVGLVEANVGRMPYDNGSPDGVERRPGKYIFTVYDLPGGVEFFNGAVEATIETAWLKVNAEFSSGPAELAFLFAYSDGQDSWLPTGIRYFIVGDSPPAYGLYP